MSPIEEFPAIKKAVNNGIVDGLHRLHSENTDPTYLEAQEYVIRHIKAQLDGLPTWKPGPGEFAKLVRELKEAQ